MSRYVVEQVVGRGGMATVELAHDPQLGRKVAIKRLASVYAGDEVFRERFLREARLAARLSHPNIVGVYDVGEDDGLPYIVMEYVEGESMAELLAREGPIDPDRVVDLVLQVCAGLEHAHAAGLVHRDVKPQNLLVRPDGTVKIADFGIARPADGTQLTQAGTVLGTAAYLAPEQAAGDPVTAAADIYSLGAVTYELLAGRPPYSFETLAAVAAPRRPPAPIPGVPEDLRRVVTAALSPAPEARPRSAAALAHDLAQVLPEPPTEPLPEGQVTAATQVVPRSGPTIQVSRRALLALAALLAAAALVGGLALARVGDEPQAREPATRASNDPVVLPRGDTPAESARLLADWLRARAE